MPLRKLWDHAINLKDTFQPKKGCIIPLSLTEQEEVSAFIDDQLQKGYIQPSKSEQTSPFFFVSKKDGKKWMVQDYRYLNEYMVKNNYPLPLISQLVNKLKGAKLFTKMEIDPFVVEMYIKYSGIYEHLEEDIIHQPGENEYLYAHYRHTRLVSYGSENQFAVSDILPQYLWNELMDAWWRWIWKRKNLWYDAWKDAEFQIFCLRACYEPRFPIAPHPIADGHRDIGPGVQEVQEGGNNEIPPVPEQRASLSPALGLAPAHLVRRSIRTICQVRVRGAHPY